MDLLAPVTSDVDWKVLRQRRSKAERRRALVNCGFAAHLSHQQSARIFEIEDDRFRRDRI